MHAKHDYIASGRDHDSGARADDRSGPGGGNGVRGILYGLPISVLLWGVIGLLIKLVG